MVRLAGGLVSLLAVGLALGWVFMAKPWSGSAEPPEEKKGRDEFAADRSPPPAREVAFDAKRAMGYLEDICKIGPRISGSEGMKKQQELLRKHFEELGAKVEFQRFPARQQSRRQAIEMANLIVSWHPERTRRVILCSHYDTRPIADQEPDRRKWHEPFVSANDGGSGVALLMELGRHMKKIDAAVGVDFVFFDGEEYIFDADTDRYFLGSEHFGADYNNRTRRRVHYAGAILLDMVGGKNARFPREPQSLMRAGALVLEVWKIAAELKCTAFSADVGREVFDDHIALNRAGIPAIDIIDFDYPHWHLLTDTPANCSGDSLEQVARVLVAWLQRVK